MAIMLLSLNTMAAPPAWSVNTAKDHYLGVSNWLHRSQPDADYRAKQQACGRARKSLAEYFGVSISSQAEITRKKVKQGNKQSSYQETIKSRVDHALKGIGIVKKQLEINLEKTHVKGWCLLVLDELKEAEIWQEVKTDKQQFSQALIELEKAIRQKKSEQASLLLSRAEGFHAARMSHRLTPFRKKVKILRQSQLHIKFAEIEPYIAPGDEIQLALMLNRNAFVYLFYDHGDYIQLIYPNRIHLNPYLKAEQLLRLPTDSMQAEDLLLLADHTVNKTIKFVAVASRKRLNYGQKILLTENDFVEFDPQDRWQDEMTHCLLKKTCITQEKTIEIRVSHKNIELEIHHDEFFSDSVKTLVRQAFGQHHYHIQPSAEKRINLHLQQQQKYSEKLGKTVFIITAVADIQSTKHRLQTSQRIILSNRSFTSMQKGMFRLVRKIIDVIEY